jgi:hypothetical protein
VVVNGAMKETFAAEGVPAIMNFTFFPWGNAYYNTSQCGTNYFDKQRGMYCWLKECGGQKPPADCFKGKKWCQHGDGECLADTIEGCAIKHYPDPSQYMDFAVCFEGVHQSKASAAEGCATAAKMDYSVINTCVTGSEADDVDAFNARATARYGTSRLGTPWVVVNGKALNDPTTLLKTVCREYTGTKPAGCN